ncbi:hypothetical protein BTJ39_14240 [Izhakiella australiensis]|uniref:Fimbrial chaperone protein n=1 Tax=Izhakiella australiensis TaxID=1926881 RepID=A0A1S8YK22_9GAMM|nr:molecular chaperone [Izhakiella australiensis]OON39434.1 hypothetical protein BTJ39_14240 [Izhakiella australiensis]
MLFIPLLPLNVGRLCALLILLTAFFHPAYARIQAGGGIELDVTRVIFSEKDKNGVTLKVHNKTDNVFLLQAQFKAVDPSTGLASGSVAAIQPMPFIVTPPLSRLEAHSELVLRIRRNEVPLSDKKESVYFISLRTIPAQKREEKTNYVAMVVVTNLKVFFRPYRLKKRVIDALSAEVRFLRNKNRLIVKNPTPYWLTFASLQIGHFHFDNDHLRLMVPPQGERVYRIPDRVSGEVKWELMDEDGWKTEIKRQEL